MNKAKRLEILTRLRDNDPHPTTELNFSSPFELLIAVLLSAQATDVGVNNSGAVKGLQGLVELINNHTLDAKASYGSTMAGMRSGNVAAMINGPWTWKTLADAGIKFGVAPIPTIGGSAGKPFVGVLTYLVTSKSK